MHKIIDFYSGDVWFFILVQVLGVCLESSNRLFQTVENQRDN